MLKSFREEFASVVTRAWAEDGKIKCRTATGQIMTLAHGYGVPRFSGLAMPVRWCDSAEGRRRRS